MTDSPNQPSRDDGELTDGPALVIRLRVAPAPVPPPPDAPRMRVTTESGTVYELDPRAMTAVRLRSGEAELRRNGEQLRLLGWPTPTVGQCLELQLMVREDGVPTVRRTTPVLRVEHHS